MTEKIIFVPLFPKLHSKNGDLPKPSLFENFVGSTPPSPQQKGGFTLLNLPS